MNSQIDKSLFSFNELQVRYILFSKLKSRRYINIHITRMLN